MKIQKILLSTLLILAISPRPMVGGTVEKSSICGSNIIINTNKIDRKTMCLMSAGHNAGELVIKQTENPCFFMDKEQWEAYGGKKVNYNTVSFTAPKGKENLSLYFGAEQRPDLGHNLIFHKDGSITSKIDEWEVIQVLGKSKQCYLKPTVEEWTLYSKEYKKGRKVIGKAKFYLK